MDKKKLLYGAVGLVIGLLAGYFATDALNRNLATATNAAPNARANAAELPPDHPPAGSPASGASASDASGADAGGMQGDVGAVIQQARNEPKNFDAQMKAAGLYTQINRFEQALEFYQKAYELKKTDLGVLVALGNAHFDLRRYVEAERYYKEALKLKPDDVNLRTDLGLSYFLREPKELDKAIAEYRTALGYNAKHEQTLQNLVAALIAKGDNASARPYLQQLEQVNPNNEALAQLRTQLN